MGFIFIWSGLICCFTDIFWFFLVCNICYWVYFFCIYFVSLEKVSTFAPTKRDEWFRQGIEEALLVFTFGFVLSFLLGPFWLGFWWEIISEGSRRVLGLIFFWCSILLKTFFLKSLFCKKNCYYLCSRNASVTGCLEKKTRVIFEIFS